LTSMALQNTADGILETLDLTIFVPCYNESTRIEGTLRTIQAAHQGRDTSYEVIVVDDGSKDDTVAVVQGFIAANPGSPIRLHKNTRNLGLARSLVETSFIGKG